MEYPEVFIFCSYLDEWNPRAVIAEISKFDDFTRTQMDKMVSVGNIIENVHETIDKIYNEEGDLIESTHRSLGYRALNSDTIINDEDIDLCFRTWESHADGLHRHFSSKRGIPEWMKYASEYYINDVNGNLSPIKLHETLSTLTCNPQYPEHKFIVKHCVLLSEIPLNKTEEDHIKPLRFFVILNDNSYETSYIEEKIKEIFDVECVLLSSANYGFLTPKTMTQWEHLEKGEFNMDIATIVFG